MLYLTVICCFYMDLILKALDCKYTFFTNFDESLHAMSMTHNTEEAKSYDLIYFSTCVICNII